MKKILLIILLAISMDVFGGSVMFLTGNDLIRWYKGYDNAQINAYVSGVVDGMPNILEKLICIPIGTEVQQISQITYNYLQKNPTQWALNGAYIVEYSLMDAYPCKK